MRIIHVLRKPLSEGTVAANTLKHGTGGLNIDTSRIASNGSHVVTGVVRRGKDNLMADRTGIGDGPGMYAAGSSNVPSDAQKLGRWPANVILQHLDGCRCEGVKKVKGTGGGASSGDNAFGQDSGWNAHQNRPTNITRQMDKDGKETVANGICEPGCPVAGLDEQSGERKTTWISPTHKNNRDGDFMGALNHPGHQGFNDTGGASRFYKQVGGKTDG